MLNSQWRAISNREELSELCEKLRTDGRRLTNLIIGSERLYEAADAGLLRTHIDDPGGMILFDDRGVQRVHYIQKSPDAAINALLASASAFHHRTVIDVTGRDGTFEIADNIFKRSGFSFYKCFRRMSRRHGAIDVNLDSRIASGTPQDVEDVYDMIGRVFDPLAEFLPSPVDLQNLLHRGGILISKSGTGSILGFLVHEAIGNTSLLRYVAVASSERGKGLGGALIDRYLNDTANAVRHDLWVWEQNEVALKHYAANGFAFTGQCNVIYLFKE